MTTLLPQDIAQLTSDAGFALKTYRTFERPPHRNQATPAIGAVPEIAAQIHAFTRAVHQSVGPAAMVSGQGAGIAEIMIPAAVHVRPDDDRSFRALDALRRTGRTGARMHQKPTVALFASSGGCGVTTIAATLARLLSGSSEAIALLDDTPQSLLGAYFGVRTFGTGVRTIAQPSSDPRACVHVINRPRAVSGDWVASACSQLDGEFDRMIVDLSPVFPLNYLQKALRDAIAIVPLLPDLRTACRLEMLLEGLMSLRDECGAALPIYFLLSQFDSNVRLHCEIADWLQEAYGPMVLPLMLRRGDEVSEALADGGTVVDYAPNSGIAHDFRSLASWIRQLPSIGSLE